MRKDKKRMFGLTMALMGALLLMGCSVNEVKSNCLNVDCEKETTTDSFYCEEHKPEEPYEGIYDTGSYTYTPPSTTATTTTTKSTYKSTYKSSYSKKDYGNYSSSIHSYDEGYDDVYENEDYDWDRYYSDPDYADGVDDAMEDADW